MNDKLGLLVTIVLIAAVLFNYNYSRLKPILTHTVAYTYDQGRDFYKAAEIVTQRDLTFIGPTTGIDGLFHGAWWYYYLTIPFLLFQGNTIGFYYANLIIHLLSLGLLSYMFSKYFHRTIAISIAALIAVSPYFIYTSIFVGNNIMVLPSMIIFLLTHFLWFEKYPNQKYQQNILATLMGLSLGLVSEFEFAFGLMIIPVYMVISSIMPDLRTKLIKKSAGLYFASGMIIAFLPRILFELKNNFSQTQTLLSFINEPKLYNPKPYHEIIVERFHMITGYYTVIFPDSITMWITTCLIVLSIIVALWHKKIQYLTSILFLSLLVVGLYFTSTLYKDNFWPNYYEGFPYIYIVLIAILLLNFKHFLNTYRTVMLIPATLLLLVGSIHAFEDYQKPLPPDGLKTIEAAVNYINSEEKNDKYCVKIYTPPAIPHTYHYLFFLKSYQTARPIPETDWVDGRCWIVLETDNYVERKESWIKDNIPPDARIIQENRFYDIDVQLRVRDVAEE